MGSAQPPRNAGGRAVWAANDGRSLSETWPRLTKKANATFADYNAQDQYVYFPGLHNLALMEMFGLIAITPEQPSPGKGWRLRKLPLSPGARR